MMRNIVDSCTEYVDSGKMEIDGYRYIEGKHIVARNKQNKDEYIDISLEYKTITLHVNTLPKEFATLLRVIERKRKNINPNLNREREN